MTISDLVKALAVAAVVAQPAVVVAQTPAAQPAPKAPDSLVLYFNLGSATVRPQDEALLDQASRLYRDGNPIVMVVAGGTDTVGAPEHNLLLSQQRADAVVRGLIARGIPAARFQLVAKGESEPAVATADDVANDSNRRVEITWR